MRSSPRPSPCFMAHHGLIALLLLLAAISSLATNVVCGTTRSDRSCYPTQTTSVVAQTEPDLASCLTVCGQQTATGCCEFRGGSRCNYRSCNDPSNCDNAVTRRRNSNHESTICTLPVATTAPTEAPTETPTQAPTETPTQAPTETPTQAPTETPKNSPTTIGSDTTISPFPCTSNMANHPLQILDNSVVTSLDPSTGPHTPLWTLTSTNSDPPFININAADISSRDTHAYAIFTVTGSLMKYLARFDQSAVEFVARFPHECNANAAVFDRAGDFYVACETALYTISRPDTLTGFKSVPELLSADSPQLDRLPEGMHPPNIHGVSDLAALFYDFGGSGHAKNWLLGLANHGVQANTGSLVLLNTDDKVHYELALSNFKYGHGYGAAWTHQDNNGTWHVYFAANNGAGIFELDLSSVDLSKSTLSTHGATLEHVGPSSQITLNNDGMYCKRSVHPYPCAPDTPPLQLAQSSTDKNYTLSSLNIKTGEHTEHWMLSKTMTNPPYVDINAADISSRDDHVYGIFTLEGAGQRYLARFDQAEAEFVAKFPVDCNLNAGAFDRSGHFYASCGSQFYQVQRPDMMIGYGSHQSIPDSATATLLLDATTPSVSDIVAISRDIARTGAVQTWLLGIASTTSGAGTLVLVCVDTLRAFELQLIGFEYGHGWGAAWNHWDVTGATQKVFFAANNGKGLFELDMASLDLTKSHSVHMGAALKYYGVESKLSSYNDGLYCNPPIYSTCGDQSGVGVLPDLNPITDAQCGAGFRYNSEAASRQCLGSPCHVGSKEALDQATCCSGGGGGGMPFWLIYIIFAVFLLLVCCCVLLYFLVYRKEESRWYEFEPKTQKHVDQVSEYTRTRATSEMDMVDLNESYEVEMVDVDLDHDQDVTLDMPTKSRDTMGVGLAAVMAAAKWKSKLIKKKERPLIYRVAAREWHGTQLEPSLLKLLSEYTQEMNHLTEDASALLLALDTVARVDTQGEQLSAQDRATLMKQLSSEVRRGSANRDQAATATKICEEIVDREFSEGNRRRATVDALEDELEFEEFMFSVSTSDKSIEFDPDKLTPVLLKTIGAHLQMPVFAMKVGRAKSSLLRKDVGTISVQVLKDYLIASHRSLTKEDNMNCTPAGYDEPWDVSLTQSPVKLPVSLQFRVSTGRGQVAFNAELFMDRFLDKLCEELQVPLNALSVLGIKVSILRKDVAVVSIEVDGKWAVRGVRSTASRAEFAAASHALDGLLDEYTVSFAAQNSDTVTQGAKGIKLVKMLEDRSAQMDDVSDALRESGLHEVGDQAAQAALRASELMQTLATDPNAPGAREELAAAVEDVKAARNAVAVGHNAVEEEHNLKQQHPLDR